MVGRCFESGRAERRGRQEQAFGYRLAMSWVAGVDGCRKGWIRVCRESQTGQLAFDVLETVEELVERAPHPAIIALDMPIGLRPAGQRDCDCAARALLGRPRASSVFRAPIRPALAARSRAEADAITRDAEGKGVGAQAWGIYAKVRSVDETLASQPNARAAIREVHPEVSFQAWNQGQPMAYSKKKREGRAERLTLVESWLGVGTLARARGEQRKKDLADDDILDAIAALWTAHRIVDGTAETLPDRVTLDQTGLPMQIVF